MIILKNDFLKVEVNPKGAELTSIFRSDIQKELLWQADTTYWGRHAPVLFPFVGKLKNDSYEYMGKSYQCSQHGFARDEQFTINSQTSDSVELSLKFSDHSLQLFPFRFHLVLGYTLKRHQLICSCKVKNADNQTMYFSIGAHPGFICPFGEGETLNDYTLVFEHAEKANRQLLTSGLFDYHTEPVLIGSSLQLNEELFSKDALVFKQLRSSKVSLRSDKNPYSITVTFNNFPYLGIWKKPAASFICIEPWFGLADYINHNGKIEEKEGIQRLAPGEIFEATYTIEIN